MSKFHYVYVIESLSRHGQYYIGFTDDLDDRLKHHNGGVVPSTAPYRPWVYRTCIAFADRERALALIVGPHPHRRLCSMAFS